jgi:endonuclease III
MHNPNYTINLDFPIKKKRGRPAKPKKDPSEVDQLKALIQRQDEGIAQGLDQVDDLLKQVDFYRKQVNHLLALCNILSKGA